MNPTIGLSHDASRAVAIRSQGIVDGRLLIQGNSGSGKSWALRRLLEQTHGLQQQIVIDVEDEFHTLREKHDYILAGKGVECVVAVKSAQLLARRLLEFGVSSIVNISELQKHERMRFVKLFLDALLDAPRALWHNCLVVIDEAHIFCPQATNAESTGSVIDLMTRGRKRGLAGILATQRISKLHKDAAAECNSKLIGKSSLDVDMKRAADELGFTTRADMLSLRTLHPGQFYAFGPAFDVVGVEKIAVGEVSTTHPRPGARSAPVPPPRAKVQKVLAQLADLAKEADVEAKTIDDLKREIAQLKRAEKTVHRVEGKIVERVVERPVLAFDPKRLGDMKVRIDEMGSLSSWLSSFLKELQVEANKAMAKVVKAQARTPMPLMPLKSVNPKPYVKPEPNLMKALDRLMPENGNGLGKCERAILTALAQIGDQATKRRVALYSGYSLNSGGFKNSISKLCQMGQIVGSDLLSCTQDGLATLGDFDPLPRGDALRQHWMRHPQLGKCERVLFERLCEAYPNPVGRGILGELTGYSSNSGGFKNSLSRLRTLELIEGRDPVIASKELFEE